MIIHLDSESPKPIEQKIQELILRKLFIKVDDEKIFIDKAEFVKLILRDIIVLAKADFDIDSALQIALQEQPEYQSMPDTKRNELEEAAGEFQFEIDAYRFYLDGLNDEMDEDEIYSEVQSILNSEFELLERKLHDLMVEALSKKLSGSDAAKLGLDSSQLLDSFAHNVKLIASNETVDDAVEEAYLEFDEYPNKHLIKKENVKKEFERFAPLAQEEINAYKMALSLNDQSAEFSAILATVKQLLNL